MHDPVTPGRARVLVADQATEQRATLTQLLERSGRFDVVAEAVDGFDAVNEAKAQQPDVSVLSLTLPRLSGLEALRYVRAAVPSGVVVVTSSLGAEATPPRAGAFVEELSAMVGLGGAPPDDGCEIDLPASAVGAAIAREFVDEQLRARGRDDVTGVTTLLASEVVTNAVVHARSASRLSIVRVGDAVRNRVTDWGGGAVVLRQLTPMAIGGRGLHIVDALADVWGTVATREWKMVWFEVGGARAVGDHDETTRAAAFD